jgi:hypothetical protein
MIRLWDYLRSRERNEMRVWANEVNLQKRDRAQLNQKLDMLHRLGFEMARQMHFLAGTSGDHNSIFKLVVHSERMLRPMLCRGPFDMPGEVTLLCGAIEKDRKLIPPDAADAAERHRRSVLESNPPGADKRIDHARF